MDVLELWKCLTHLYRTLDAQDLSKHFAIRYAVYHFYRSQGWIVKCGLKFGTDFVLYKKGPIFSHSDFAVIIQPVNSTERDEEEGQSWSCTLGMLRVCSQVKKRLLFCYVNLPRGFSSKDLKSPGIISTLTIWDASLFRWVPSRTLE